MLTAIHKQKTRQSNMNTLKIKGDWDITRSKLNWAFAKAMLFFATAAVEGGKGTRR